MGKDIKDLDALLEDEDTSQKIEKENTFEDDSLKKQFNKVFYKNQSKDSNDPIGENLDKFEDYALNNDDMMGLTNLLNNLNTSLIEKKTLYPQIKERLKESEDTKEIEVLNKIKVIYEKDDYTNDNKEYQKEINVLLDELEDITGNDDILFNNTMNEDILKNMVDNKDGCAQQ
ncbi:uncharacterized protein HGUI_02108 [Hanseniaspora guilliermondii]|uniref:Uncharacterized protein n=1 Tax=Hanseniaspora guilliermondii TaxID=56406 RepID=A0A1L0B261_9ASCO|nr:uncharacterized protein HGUI_02108 [Hanseniaspora guilliermondii]